MRTDDSPCTPGQYLGRINEKANLLRKLCGGRLHRWLARWRADAGMDLTPWPGWPVSRLILARTCRRAVRRHTRSASRWTRPRGRGSGERSAGAAWSRGRSSGALSPAMCAGPLFAVPDTLAGLATSWRAPYDEHGAAESAAVTGSVGKTTTKEILAALLGSRFRVLKIRGQSEQRVRPAADAAAAGTDGRSGGGRDGHVPSRRTRAPGGNRRARRWRRHARRAGALNSSRRWMKLRWPSAN